MPDISIHLMVDSQVFKGFVKSSLRRYLSFGVRTINSFVCLTSEGLGVRYCSGLLVHRNYKP